MAGKKVVGELIASIRLKHAQLEDDLQQARKKFTKFGKDVDRIGREISKKFGLSFTAIGSLATLAAQEMDDALDKIRISTGATGKALEGLNKDFKAVSRGVPDSFAKVSQAVGDLNTRLGLTGQPLQELAKQTLNLARLTGSDLGAVIQTNTRVFGDWGIKMEDTAKAQDFLFKVNQQTGVSIQSLGETIVKAGAPLRQFGFDFEEAAALIGKFDKEGVNTEIVLSGLRAALGRLSKSGIELEPGLATVIEGIKNIGSTSEANKAAIEIFGQKAGADLAAAIREGRFEIDELLKRLRESPETINKAAEDTDGFAEELLKFGKVAKEVFAQFGNAIMTVLTPVLRVLRQGLEGVANFLETNFGKAILKMVAILGGIVTVAGPVILAIKGIIAIFGLLVGWPAVIIAAFVGLLAAWETWGGDVTAFFNRLWNELKLGFDGIQAKVYQLSQFLGYLKELELPWNAWAKATQDYDWALGQLQQKWQPTIEGTKQTAEATGKYATAMTEAEAKAKALKEEQDKAGASGQSFEQILKKLQEGADGGAKALEKQAEKVKKLREEWSQYIGDFNSNKIQGELQKGLESSLENFDKATFDKFAEQMRSSIEEETFKKLAEKYKDIIPESEIRAQAQNEAQIKADEYKEQWTDKAKQAHEEGIEFWRSTFENAITGVTFNLEDALKQVAVGFAAEIAQSIFGSLSGLKIDSPQGLGGSLAQMLLGQFGLGGSGGTATSILGDTLGQSIGGSITDALGLSGGISGLIGSFGMSGSAAAAARIQGPVMASGAFSAGSGILGAMGPWGMAAMAALAIGSQTDWFGLANSGPDHPETKARKKFTEELEKIVDKLGGLKFFDESGAARNVTDFKSRSTQWGDFTNAGWAQEYGNKYGANAGIFSGVGNALGAAMGVEDLPFEQIGPMLAESLGGSLEGLKALLNTVGISAQEMQDALLQAGKEGKITWGEFEASLQSVDRAMKPGLEAVGAFAQAFDNLLRTGARGQIALDQLKNVAIEAKEAGVSSLEELRAQLLASGKFTESQIGGLMQALAQRGIKSLEDLAKAPERVLGGIIADMQALGVNFTDALSPIEATKEALEQIPDNSTKNIHFNVTASVAEDVRKYVSPNVEAAQGFISSMGGAPIQPFAKGGIVTSPSLFGFAGNRVGLMGEKGAEAIMPLTRGPGGRLGVQAIGGGARSTVYNIDARGAAPGVETAIVAALDMVENRAAQRAVVEVMDYLQRSGR